MTAQPDRSETVLGKLLSDGRFTLASLARGMGISEPQIKAYRYGRQRFPTELLPDLWEAVAELDASLADWAVNEAAGLAQVGRAIRPTIAGVDRDPIVTDALQLGAALGHLNGELVKAGAEVDHVEAARMLDDARRLQSEAAQLVAKLERIAAAPGVA